MLTEASWTVVSPTQVPGERNQDKKAHTRQGEKRESTFDSDLMMPSFNEGGRLKYRVLSLLSACFGENKDL